MLTALYLDSADVAHWRQAYDHGWARRITCNPLLLHEAGWPVNMDTACRLTAHAQEMGLSQWHLQAWPEAGDDWLPVAQMLADLDPRVVVKLPAVPAAMSIVPLLKQQGTQVLVTAVNNPLQGLWAAEVGADFVAPYVGRLLEAGRDAWALLETLVALQNQGGPTVLAASVRDTAMLGRLIQMGVGAVTLRHALLASASQEPMTLDALAQFEAVRTQA